MSGECREIRRLATLERKNGEEQVRWSWDEFTPANGEPSRYVSIRKWFRARNGDWRPTKAGATIRLNELDEVVAALQRVQRARDSNRSHGDNSTHTHQRDTEHQEPVDSTGRHPSPDELDEIF